MHYVWANTGTRFAEIFPDRYKIPLGALVVIGVFIVGSFASPESQDNTRAVISCLSLSSGIG